MKEVAETGWCQQRNRSTAQRSRRASPGETGINSHLIFDRKQRQHNGETTSQQRMRAPLDSNMQCESLPPPTSLPPQLIAPKGAWTGITLLAGNGDDLECGGNTSACLISKAKRQTRSSSARYFISQRPAACRIDGAKARNSARVSRRVSGSQALEPSPVASHGSHKQGWSSQDSKQSLRDGTQPAPQANSAPCHTPTVGMILQIYWHPLKGTVRESDWREGRESDIFYPLLNSSNGHNNGSQVRKKPGV